MPPTHFDTLPEDHEANLLFSWFLEEGGELGVVHDEAKARRLCHLSNVYAPDANYELLEAVVGDQSPFLKGDFLGYDLSQGLDNSLLWWGLEVKTDKLNEDQVQILASIVFPFFAQQLNRYGLFSDIHPAIKCHKSLIALQALEPNFIEGGDLNKFQVVGLYHLDGSV